MLTLYQVKPAFQKRLRSRVALLARWGITPNQITLAAIALASVTGLAIACFPNSSIPLLMLPIALLVRMALNAMDGLLARDYGLTSPLGCVLNEVGDVVADGVIYLPFSLIPGVAAPAVVIVVLLAGLTEFVGVLGQTIAPLRPYDGPLGKSDRALVFAVLGLLLGWGVPPGPWLTVIWWMLGGLSLWTIANRLQAALREVSPCH